MRDHGLPFYQRRLLIETYLTNRRISPRQGDKTLPSGCGCYPCLFAQGSDLIVNVDEDSGSGWKIDPNSWRVFVRGLKFFLP